MNRKNPLARQLRRLEAQAAEQQERLNALLADDRGIEERICRRYESATEEERGRLWLIIVGVMAANAGEADTLHRLGLMGFSDEDARAWLAAAQEHRRQNPTAPAARSSWDRFDPEGRPYATPWQQQQQRRRY